MSGGAFPNEARKEEDFEPELTYLPTDDEEPAAAPAKLIDPDSQPFKIPRGKYAGLILPKMVGVKLSKLQQAMAIREQIVKDPEFQQKASSIVQTYVNLRLQAEEKQAELDELRMRLTAVMLIMNDQFDAEDTLSLGIRDIGVVRVQPEPHAIVLDPDAHRRWAIENGYENSLTLHWGKTNRITKEMLLAHKGEPDGVTAFMRPKVVFTEDKVHKAMRLQQRAARLGIVLTDADEV